jgi:hypothetical protein
LYARNLARNIHKLKTPMLLFKLNINKAFDLELLDGFASTFGMSNKV